MDAGDIARRHVDFEIIEKFQRLDPRYCTKKFQKLENRLITRDIPIIAKSKTTTVRKVETKNVHRSTLEKNE